MFTKEHNTHFFRLFRNRYLIEMIYDFLPFSDIIQYSNSTRNVFAILNKKYSFKDLSLATNRIIVSHKPSCIFEWGGLTNLHQILKQSTIALTQNQEEYIICYFLKNMMKRELSFTDTDYNQTNLIGKVLRNVSSFTHINQICIKKFINKLNEAIETMTIRLTCIKSIQIYQCESANEDQYRKFFALFIPENIRKITIASSISSINSKAIVSFVTKCSPCLQSLILALNTLDESFIHCIIKIIKTNNSMQYLRLEGNSIMTDSSLVKQLIIAYNANSSLEIFHFDNNNIKYNKTHFLSEFHQIYFNDKINNMKSKLISYKDHTNPFNPNDIYEYFFHGRIRSKFNVCIEFESENFAYIIDNMSFSLFNFQPFFNLSVSDKLFVTKYNYCFIYNQNGNYCCVNLVDVLAYYKSIVKLTLIFEVGDQMPCELFFKFLAKTCKEKITQPKIIQLQLNNIAFHFSIVDLISLVKVFPKLKVLKFNNCKISYDMLNELFRKLIKQNIKIENIIIKHQYINLKQKEIDGLKNEKIRLIISD